MDIQAEGNHQGVSVILDPKNEVKRVISYHKSA